MVRVKRFDELKQERGWLFDKYAKRVKNGTIKSFNKKVQTARQEGLAQVSWYSIKPHYFASGWRDRAIDCGFEMAWQEISKHYETFTTIGGQKYVRVQPKQKEGLK